MSRDFTIIFQKMAEQDPIQAPQKLDGGVMLPIQGIVELDELAELRRVVTEITDPEPLSFTTT